jgi:hypothetical protein
MDVQESSTHATLYYMEVRGQRHAPTRLRPRGFG